MKLTIALWCAALICAGSFVAKAGITHRQQDRERAAVKAEFAGRTPRSESERIAMLGVEGRLQSRLHRLAAAPGHAPVRAVR